MLKPELLGAAERKNRPANSAFLLFRASETYRLADVAEKLSCSKANVAAGAHGIDGTAEHSTRTSN
jgi:hypothetical protein